MLRKNNYERSVTDGWASLDPVDRGAIEKLYKKQIREGEEALMLAVLDSAIECFQKYAFAARCSAQSPVSVDGSCPRR